MAKRAVGYSRYSTDLQDEKSIEDQEMMLRLYAEKCGYDLVKLYSDAAQSGGSMFGRPGLFDMLTDAKLEKFDVVLVEELDRLSRDMEDLAGIHKRLTYDGIEIEAIHEGTANTITVGLRGLVGQLFREDNARKTRRGLQGKIKAGLSAGGLSYGYRIDPLNKGGLFIVQEQADVVLRIFEEYERGKSPRTIAQELNAEGAPTARGIPWTASTIYGWAERGQGILRNPLYAGKLVWNKNRLVKNPDTGKRVTKPNPPSEWHTTDMPDLRIVPQDLFDRVQVMIKPRERTPAQRVAMRRPTRMLSGMLKCGSCGGGMSAKGQDKSGRTRIECSRHRDHGNCPDPQTFYLDVVEQAVVQVMRQQLEDPQLMTTYVEAYNAARMKHLQGEVKHRQNLEKKIKNLDAEVSRILEFVAQGVGDKDRIATQYAEKSFALRDAKEELAKEPVLYVPAALHPEALKGYRKDLSRLTKELTDGVASGDGRLAKSLRDLVHSLSLRRGPEQGTVKVTMIGALSHLITTESEKTWVGGSLVARGGLEPPTPRL
jgi:site-specific DNA recombinase